MTINTKDKIKVMQHYLDGGDIEVGYYIGSRNTLRENFRDVKDEPIWDWGSSYYRIKKIPSGDIPWNAISEKWKYAAVDKDGKWYLYVEKPNLGVAWWAVGLVGGTTVVSHILDLPVVEDWKKSLCKRPEVDNTPCILI